MNYSQCPKCGTPNRTSARFCRTCRTPLHPNVTMKACPECNTPNRVDAKFCAKCRHKFGTRVDLIPQLGQLLADRKVRILAATASIGGLALCLLVSALLLVLWKPEAVPTQVAVQQTLPPISTLAVLTAVSSSPTATSAATGSASVAPTADDPLDRAKRSIVRIIVPLDSDPNRVVTGSGSVITNRGHILTNDHLFRDDNGKPYNSRGDIYIAFPPRTNLKGNAEIVYRALLARADAQNDLALLRITAQKDGRALPADLALAVLPIGDSEKLDIADQVTILGYPGLGGDSLTLTSGKISGFLQDEGYIKTDALIYPGNSGGGALNTAYELVGVASARSLSKNSPGQLGLIRPSKLAQPLIDFAKQDAGE